MHSKSKVGGNDFAPWKLPLAHSYQLHQDCNERRQSTSFLMTKESFTAAAQELPLILCKTAFHSRYELLGGMLFFTPYTFCMIRGFFQFKTLRQMTFMNCRLAFLSLIKINHVRGFRFIARKSRLSFDFSSHVSGTMNYLEL